MENFRSISKAIFFSLLMFVFPAGYIEGFAGIFSPVQAPASNLQNKPISVLPGDQGTDIDVVSDGAGGGFIVWGDEFYGNLLAQKIDANDQLLWPTNGILIAPSQWLQTYANVTSDGQGGIIVAWNEGRNDWCGVSYKADCNIYAQRINASGQAIWQASGVLITDAPHNQGVTGIDITSDGNGGAIITWVDAHPNCCRIYAQRIDATGQTKWATNGIPISLEVTKVFGPMFGAPFIIGDGEGGAIISWIENQVNYDEKVPISVQRIDPDGNSLWTQGGVRIGHPAWKEYDIIPDGIGGAVIAWPVYLQNQTTEIRVQRITKNSQIAWLEGGVTIAIASGYRNNPGVVGDGSGNFIITWADGRNGDCLDYLYGETENCDIYAQKVSSNGVALWQVNGIQITHDIGKQYAPRITSDGSGGAIIVWQDCRDYPSLLLCLPIEPSPSGMDIYAQRINNNGQAMWGLNGFPISTADGAQSMDYGTDREPGFLLLSDNNGSVRAVFPDGRKYVCVPSYTHSDCDLYAQSIRVKQLYLPAILHP